MPPNESDHIKALRNRVIEKRRALDARHRETLQQYQMEVRALEDYAKQLEQIDKELLPLLSGENMPVVKDGEPSGRIPISELIDRFFIDTGASDCTAAQVLHFIEGLGYQTSKGTYNSVHETLRRKVERGVMRKEGSKFKLNRGE